MSQIEKVCIYDRRLQNSRVNGEWLETSGLDFSDLLRIIYQRFSVPACERFVLVTTQRTVLDANTFKQLQNGATLYMLEREDQALELATEEHINFTPHYDTVVESGTFKYYDSEGKKSLPYALADLIDNALSATAHNNGARTIEIRMLFDESLGKPAVIMLDNGRGMTSKQLNNWAVYKLSKFTRENGKYARNQSNYDRPSPVPRSLNSDISYFGVGGKQAVFYIGKETRMISKPINSPDVHELVLSKALFEMKEKNKEDTYSTTILNRKPCDSSHIKRTEERFLHDLISEECNKESFTAVVITEVQQEHINFLKEDFKVWTRQLAHIYHYYIHGVNGNLQKASTTDSDQVSKIDILITLHTKNSRSPRILNLRNITDDMQSLYIRAAVSTFEFNACTNPEAGLVEGIIRYHPFLYSRETYPQDPDAANVYPEDEDDYDNNAHAQIRKNSVFQCYWNGRLIPYTTVSEFEWCRLTPKGSKLPAECYNRFSGVLFTDDTFRVTENKLTFIDLEQKLKNKDTIFTQVVKGQRQRTNLQKEFTLWLNDCHARYDKQVKFMNYQETITRTDIPIKREQHPWATFTSIEWDGKVYKTGQYVKSHKTYPIHNGTVLRFLLFGNHDHDEKGAVFAPGGQVEISLEPKGLYDKTKIIPLSKMDRNAADDDIMKNIQNDSAKLPDKLQVYWPSGTQWLDNSTHPAGTRLGPINVYIMNKKGEKLSRIPSARQGTRKGLGVELKLCHGKQEVVSSVASQQTKWGFWFNATEKLVKLGKYTLNLNCLLNENRSTEFGDKQLPYFQLRFTIKEGKAEQFDVGTVSPNQHVGLPFHIPLQIKDRYGNPVEAPPNLQYVLECSGLRVTYDEVNCKGSSLTIRNVQLRGILPKNHEPNPFDMKITLAGLEYDSKMLKINLLPGNPHSIHVEPKDSPITVENGNSVQFTVLVRDEAGNITAHTKMAVQCLVPGHPPASVKCMTGVAHHMTRPINVSIVNGKPQILKVQFKVPSQSSFEDVMRELLVTPSKRVCRMELYKGDDECLILRNNDRIQWMAGGVFENLFFRLYDEASRLVPLTADVASKIKVNWTGDMSQSDVIEGRLPDIQVPTKLMDRPFYQVSYQDQSISVSFIIEPLPDEPAALKATLECCTLKLGQILSEPILLVLVDQYDNVTKTLTQSCVKEIVAEGEGLDTSSLAFMFQESSCSVLVTGVCFTCGTPGHRELKFNFKSFFCSLKLNIVAGAPASLLFVSEPTQPLQILNGHGIPTPFLIQMCDKWGNPSIDQRVVVKISHSPSELTVISNVTSQPVNADGQASFTVNRVSGPKGCYWLNFKGIFNKEPIAGPSVNLTVLPDPNKPVSLNVQYDTSAIFTAGKQFPVFSVTVISDEGCPITSFNTAAVSMLWWEGVLLGKAPPSTSSKFQCSKPMENEKKGSFYFRDKPVPERVGKYTIQFCLSELNKKILLYSQQITINVMANQPVKLAPESPLQTQVVSYSEDISKRILVENLTLRIMDQYDNPAGQELSGKVEICIKNSKSKESLPLFEGKLESLKMQLLDGEARITRLAIMENSPGEHGATYTVLFRPVLSTGPTVTLASYEFPFIFTNDSQNQQIILERSRKRETLNATIQKLTNQMDLREKIIAEYSILFEKSSMNELTLRTELNRSNLNIQKNAPIETIAQIHDDMHNEARRIHDAPRRTYNIHHPYMGTADVLGNVGNLAKVEEDTTAWVISWLLRGDMDCVITTTTAAAQRIYNDTGGRQQVMPLDTINADCRRPFPPLPHIRNGINLFDPMGNPVYVVDVLIYPQHQKDCEIVFRNLIGNTILIDDLDTGNMYRRMVVQNNMSCPTILTRQGDQISSKGNFGGAQNKAPPVGQLHLFGAPLPERYHQLQHQIDLLRKYKNALEKKLQTRREYDEVKKRALPINEKTENERKELCKQLQEVERQLAIQVRPNKRVSVDCGETSGMNPKRPK